MYNNYTYFSYNYWGHNTAHRIRAINYRVATNFRNFFPFSEVSWQKEFDKYKQIPEFFLVNSSMTLAEFKIIYFWEWFHRSLARFLGLVFLIPYLYFTYKKKFSKKENLSPVYFTYGSFTSIRWLVYGTKWSCRKY